MHSGMWRRCKTFNPKYVLLSLFLLLDRSKGVLLCSEWFVLFVQEISEYCLGVLHEIGAISIVGTMYSSHRQERGAGNQTYSVTHRSTYMSRSFDTLSVHNIHHAHDLRLYNQMDRFAYNGKKVNNINNTSGDVVDLDKMIDCGTKCLAIFPTYFAVASNKNKNNKNKEVMMQEDNGFTILSMFDHSNQIMLLSLKLKQNRILKKAHKLVKIDGSMFLNQNGKAVGLSLDYFKKTIWAYQAGSVAFRNLYSGGEIMLNKPKYIYLSRDCKFSFFLFVLFL